MVRVLDTDNADEMADKIFFHFEVLQSCAIQGWIQIQMPDGDIQVLSKAEEVVRILNGLDEEHNCLKSADGRKRRKQVKFENSIGGYVSQKIFKFSRGMVDDHVRYTIWRIQ